MSTASEKTPYTVFIEFDVDPENQTALIEEILSWGNPSGHPGFVSATRVETAAGC